MSRVRILSAAVAAAGFVMLTASAAVAADAASGEEAFTHIGCWTCHGTVGQGGRGPAIGPNPMPLAAFVAYVRILWECPPFAKPFFPVRNWRTFTPIWNRFRSRAMSKAPYWPSRHDRRFSPRLSLYAKTKSVVRLCRPVRSGPNTLSP